MRFDKAFLISLEQSPRRRDHFYRNAEQAGLKVETYNAIYGLDVDTEDYQRRGYLADDFKLTMAGSLGTLLSHVHIWETIADDPDCDTGLIFEDDAVIKPDFVSVFENLDETSLPDDWDMLWIGWHRLDCKPINKIIGKPGARSKRGANSGHFAYLIKSSSVPKMKSILLPYNNRSSKDVILRKNFHRFNAYFLLKKIVTTPLLGFDSVRKKINKSQVKHIDPGKNPIVKTVPKKSAASKPTLGHATP